MKGKIQLFEDHNVRTSWDEDKETWYFSIVDVVGALSDSANPTDYLKKMRRRDPELASYLGTNCPQVAMPTASGKMRKTLAGTVENVFRVIQSIPSAKAEPFKHWLARVGAERVEETIDPEQAIVRAKMTYQAKGYSPAWINQRIQGIQVRNELTDQWKAHGVQEGLEYATLTNIIHCGAFGVSVKDHKKLKGMKGGNLRDNMTTLETALTMFAEATATEMTKSQNPKTFEENKMVAQKSGGVAGRARRDAEKQIGHTIVSKKNAQDLLSEASSDEVIESENLKKLK